MLKAIHIDDDIRSVELMKNAIAGCADTELVRSFTNEREAREWLDKNKTDIIFLDIEMPGKNGIELAQELSGHNADIIFVTAHTGFAVDAFEVCALDYLIKPVYPEKLNDALERYRLRKKKYKAALPASAQIEELFNNYIKEDAYPRKIFVSMIGEIRVVDLTEIIYFAASGPYTKIYLLSGEVITSSESIKSYNVILLKHPDFVRIHRSYLINKNQISSIQRKPGDINVKMRNGDLLSVAQQRRKEIFQQITG